MIKIKRVMAAVAAALLFVICTGLWNNADAARAESMHDDAAGLTWNWTAVVEDGVRYAENVYVTGSDFAGAVLSDDFLKDKDGNTYRIRSIGQSNVQDQDHKDSFIQTDDFQLNITIDASACGNLETVNPFAFRGGAYETIVLPKTVRKVSDNAFYGAKKMTVTCENPNIIFGDMSGITETTFKWKGSELSTAYEAFSPNGQFTSNGQTAYKCTLDGNGDATDPASTEPGLFGSYIYVLADGSNGDVCKVAVPAREHYKFAGYYTAREDGVQIYDGDGELVPENVPGNVTKDTILYAHWNPVKYRISFLLGDGVTGTLADEEITYGTKYAIKDDYSDSFTKTGYSFKGWSKMGGSSNAEYSSGDSFAVTGDMDLYAVWEANRYSVEYYDSDALCGSDDAVYGKAWNLSRIEKLGISRTGHAFAGWSLEDGGKPAYIDGEEVKDLTTESDGTVELHAVWNPNSYSIIFDANSGNGTMGRQKMIYGISVSLPACMFARKGYTFLGWALENDSTKAGYADMEEVRNLSAAADGEVTLYAVWQANRYFIAYHGNGGSGTMQNTAAKYDSDVPLTRNAFTRTGYRFMGWTADKAAKDIGYNTGTEEVERIVSYRDTEIVRGITDKAEDMVHLYAVWQEIGYSIAYNVATEDDVEWSVDVSAVPAKYVYGKTVNLPILARVGYDFLGWDDGSETISAIDKSDSGNKALTAVWRKKTYSISYDDNAGTDEVYCNGMKSLSYQYGETVKLPTLSRAGYEFQGWKVDGKIAASTGGIGDKACVAVWKACIYSITYKLNGGEITDKGYAENYAYGIGTVLPTAVEKEGCTFAGWQDSSGRIVTEIGSKETGNKAYTATWTRSTYSIAIDTDGGVIRNDAGEDITSDYTGLTSYKYGSTDRIFTEPLPDEKNVMKEGYTFAGWYDAGLGQYITKIDSTICHNRDIQATWTDNAFTAIEDIEIKNTGEGKTVDIPSVPMDDDNYYYQLLSGVEKCIYTVLFNEYQFDSSSGKCNNSKIQLRSASEFTYANVKNAGVALCWSHPEIFWIRAYNNSAVEKNDGLYLSMVELKEAYSSSNYLSDASKYKGFFEEIVQSLDADNISAKSDADKIAMINTYVVDNFRYDKDTKILDATTTNETRSIGYMLASGRGCCEGYAKLTKVLCDHYGIQCVVVSGNGHMWNEVRINSVWYMVDVTWNDNAYDTEAYLLKGSKNVTDEDHTISNSFYARYGEDGKKILVTEYGFFDAPNLSENDYNNNFLEPSVTPKPSSAPGKPAVSIATVSKVVYRIAGRKAAVQKASSKKVTKITVRDSVKIDGKIYKVASIDANAFKNCKKLKAVTIKAKSLTVIGKNAFRGCGKLRSVKIKSKKINKAGKGAFKGINKKAVISVPKNRVAKYRKMFRKAGLPGVKF